MQPPPARTGNLPAGLSRGSSRQAPSPPRPANGLLQSNSAPPLSSLLLCLRSTSVFASSSWAPWDPPLGSISSRTKSAWASSAGSHRLAHQGQPRPHPLPALSSFSFHDSMQPQAATTSNAPVDLVKLPLCLPLAFTDNSDSTVTMK